MSSARRPSRLEVAARDVLERLGGELEPAGDVGERTGTGGGLVHGAALVHTAGELRPDEVGELERLAAQIAALEVALAGELDTSPELEGTGDNG